MVIPIGRQGRAQTLFRVTRQADRFTYEELMPVRFVPLVPGVAALKRSCDVECVPPPPYTAAMWTGEGRWSRAGAMTRRAAAVMATAVLVSALSACGLRDPLAVNRPPVFNPPSARTVTVLPGDTLYSIARAAGVPLRDLVRINGLKPPYLLRRGQRLALPAQRVYVVRVGDSLSRIAARTGHRMNALIRLNGLAPPYRLRVGQSLRLPLAIGRAAAGAPVVAATRAVPVPRPAVIKRIADRHPSPAAPRWPSLGRCSPRRQVPPRRRCSALQSVPPAPFWRRWPGVLSVVSVPAKAVCTMTGSISRRRAAYRSKRRKTVLSPTPAPGSAVLATFF